MTTILSTVQQLLDSDNIDGAREEVARTVVNLKKVDATVRDFAALLTLGSQKALEIGLGILGRELLKKDSEVNINVVWLLLSAVLSRQDITSDSPSRISILGLTSCVEDWESPIFALLTPALDSFLKVSLSEENPLISEQTLDFITTCGDSYAKTPRTKKQIKNLKSLTLVVLDKVDDLDIKEEWEEGLERFFQISGNTQYSDQRIWSAASDLLKTIYSPAILNSDADSNHYKVKDNIFRLIISSLAALGTTLGANDTNGLSVAVRIDNPEENKPWSVVASAIDKLERLFQEFADATFEKRITKLPAFTPAQAIPGSWTIILHIDLNDNQSDSLAKAIASLSSTENDAKESDTSLTNSWRECAAKLKEEELRVNLAVSTDNPKFYVVPSISTEDIPKIEDYPQHNIRILSRDIPQANSLDRVIDFASLLIQYPTSPSTVRQKFLEIDGIVERQFSYYRRAEEILGLADERERPTTACYMLNRLQPEAKMRFLAYQFISSNIGLAWFRWQNANDLSDIKPESASQFLIEVCPTISKETAKRRAQTLKSWLNIFLAHW